MEAGDKSIAEALETTPSGVVIDLATLEAMMSRLGTTIAAALGDVVKKPDGGATAPPSQFEGERSAMFAKISEAKANPEIEVLEVEKLPDSWNMPDRVSLLLGVELDGRAVYSLLGVVGLVTYLTCSKADFDLLTKRAQTAFNEARAKTTGTTTKNPGEYGGEVVDMLKGQTIDLNQMFSGDDALKAALSSQLGM